MKMWHRKQQEKFKQNFEKECQSRGPQQTEEFSNNNKLRNQCKSLSKVMKKSSSQDCLLPKKSSKEVYSNRDAALLEFDQLDNIRSNQKNFMNSSFMIPVPYNYTSTVDTFLKRDLRGREFGIGEFGILIGESICWDGEGLEEGKGRGETPKENCVGADGRGEKIPDFDLGNLGSPMKNRPKAPGGNGQVAGTKDERAEENLGPKGGSAHQKLGRSPSLQASSKFQIGSTMSSQQNYLKHSNPIKVNSTNHNNISILNVTETTCHKSKQTGDQKEP